MEEGVGSTDTEGAGGKMASWLNDAASWYSKANGKAFSKMSEYSLPGLAMKAAGVENPISNFYDREFVQKADLRGAEALEFSSNLPLIGNLIRGVQGVNRLEDLYNNTGRVPYYAGSGSSGAGAGASAARDLGKIADGMHDLYEFYSGTPDDFRSSQNNMYG